MTSKRNRELGSGEFKNRVYGALSAKTSYPSVIMNVLKVRTDPQYLLLYILRRRYRSITPSYRDRSFSISSIVTSGPSTAPSMYSLRAKSGTTSWTRCPTRGSNVSSPFSTTSSYPSEPPHAHRSRQGQERLGYIALPTSPRYTPSYSSGTPC